MTEAGRTRWVFALVAGAALVLTACGATTPSTPPRSVAPAPSTAQPNPTASPLAVPQTESFPYDRLTRPTVIDNPYLPLVPGAYWIWDGITIEDDEEIRHQIITTITDLTKIVDGVTARVGYEEDRSDGELVEAEIFFVVQDDDGTVWRLGEYPEEYEAGEIVGSPAWVAGAQDALAGIMMLAEPRRGWRSYAQGWGPAVDSADRGWVVVDGLRDCVATGCYDDVIVVEEWDSAEPLARQLKFHAPGVGLIRVDWSGSGDQTLEMLELVEHRTLTELELAGIRALALALDARAHGRVPDVFETTEPIEPRT